MSKVQTSMNGSHILSLIHLKTDCYYTSITADFTPPPSMNRASNSIVPAFLKDHNYFTPSFIIPREKEYYVGTLSVEKEKFQARILKDNRLCQDEISDKKTDLTLQPVVPSAKYCQICKSSFTSYQQHLKDTSHQRQTRFSKANNYISQLCKKYSKTRSKLEVKGKNKLIKKQVKQKSSQKHKLKENKKMKVVLEHSLGMKVNNCSTNLPSLIPTPY